MREWQLEVQREVLREVPLRGGGGMRATVSGALLGAVMFFGERGLANEELNKSAVLMACLIVAFGLGFFAGADN